MKNYFSLALIKLIKVFFSVIATQEILSNNNRRANKKSITLNIVLLIHTYNNLQLIRFVGSSRLFRSRAINFAELLTKIRTKPFYVINQILTNHARENRVSINLTANCLTRIYFYDQYMINNFPRKNKIKINQLCCHNLSDKNSTGEEVITSIR